MLASQRRQRILQQIQRQGAGTIAELSQKYGVSEMTIRRDLKTLEGEGHVHRTHGGAILSAVPISEDHILAREKRQQLCGERKAGIAECAAHEFVSNGDNIILEGGTSAAAMIRYLTAKRGLTIVTNGLATAMQLQPLSRSGNEITVMCAGGILRSISATFVGPVAERFFQELHVNRLFLSATGLTLAEGLTDPSLLETQVKKAMIASASQVIVLMDSSKFGAKSLITILPIEEIDVLITDEDSPPAMIEALRARGVDVRIAGSEQDGRDGDEEE